MDFNCPQYLSFLAPSEDDGDSYFDVDHEAGDDLTGFQTSSYVQSPEYSASADASDINPYLSGRRHTRNSRHDELMKEDNIGTGSRYMPRLSYTTPEIHFTRPGSRSRSKSTPFKVESTRKSAKSLPSRNRLSPRKLYELRLTPARKVRLHSLVLDDTDGYVQAALLTPTHKMLRSQTPKGLFIVQTRDAEGDHVQNKRKEAKKTASQPFHFHTDDRLKNSFKQETRDFDFVSSLRNNSPRLTYLVPRTTKPEPFSFVKSQVPEEKPQKYSTLAERVERFHRATPARFRTVARGTGPPVMEHYTHELVRPQSPRLHAVKRRRPVHVLSHQQQEELDMQKIKKLYKFHAQPFKLHSPHLPQVEHKAPTRPVDIQLETDKRVAKRKRESSKENVKEPYVFHAQEIPKNIFKGPQGVKEKKPLPITQPKSPNFASKKRDMSHDSTMVSQVEENAYLFKANPAPDYRSPFVVKHEKKCTSVQPFSFENFDKRRYELKEMKIIEEIEKQKREAEFHARPVPVSVLTPKPNRSTMSKRPLTRPEPFNFASEKLLMRKSRYQIEVENEEKNLYRFKAQPASVVKKRPFAPQKLPRTPTVARQLKLNTEERAADRILRRELQAAMEAEKQELLRPRLEEEKMRERQELKRIRLETVHRANPVPVYKEIQIKPSTKPLTLPYSPKFSTLRKRAV